MGKSNLHVVYSNKAGQYADTSFLHNRLQRYGFSFLAKIFSVGISVLGLKNKSWYAGTGSILAVIQKKHKK